MSRREQRQLDAEQALERRRLERLQRERREELRDEHEREWERYGY